MTYAITPELRDMMRTEGMPLRLVDPESGESYLLIREQEIGPSGAPLSNDQLLRLADTHRAPEAWIQSNEEDLFQ